MKVKEIRELIDFISSSELDEVNIETEEFKLSVKKNGTIINQVVSSVPVSPSLSVAPAAQTPTAQAPASEQAAPAVAKKSNFVEVKSPMIGTYYGSPSPDAEPFVKVGDTIKAGQTVCIIEAMKLFNEIESEVSGKIVEILVDNASPVEFDQPLLLVDPS